MSKKILTEYSEKLKSYLVKYDITNFDYSQFCNVKIIGSGAYATVYSATFQEKEYALKSLKNNLSLDEREFNQLQRELRLLYMTNHPNVVEFYGISQTEENFMLVLQLATGGTLRDHLQSKQEKSIYKFCGLNSFKSQRISHMD